MNLPSTLGVCAAGYLLAAGSGFVIEAHSAPFDYLTRVLLAVGLYGAVAGIQLDELRTSRFLVLKAVTGGVVVKWLLIGLVFWLYWRHPAAFILGLAVTQIDPLSVAHLVGNRRHPMSERGRAILAAWSSFDDPVTVLLVVLLLPLFGTNVATGEQLGKYAVTLALTLGTVVVAFALSRVVRGPSGRATLLIAAVGVAVAANLMLVPAVLGLFLRVPWERAVAGVVTAAYVIATLILGAVLRAGVDPVAGLVLAVAACAAQAVVAAGLTRGLPRSDRIGLSFAQQSGITAILLALWIERTHPGAAAVIGPAVLIVNLIHALGVRVQHRLGAG